MTPPPTPDEIARVNVEHLIATPLKPADLLFVFGIRGPVRKYVAAAHQLWQRGFCRWLIVSGGATLKGPMTECRVIKDAMVARGIPSEIILEERRATNTGENVIFSLPVIEAALDLKSIRSIIYPGIYGRCAAIP